MEPPSAPPHRTHVPWQGLLLTVSLLTFWNPPATGEAIVHSLPFNASEGTNVFLLVYNWQLDVYGYGWTTSSDNLLATFVIDTVEKRLGPAYSGHETIYPNATLLFRSVTLKDTGYYTLLIVRRSLKNDLATGQFHVY
uniref:Immunoglobulin V-set domain-containing protein n=1 Tax=Propithecus coquereli TaxID=379532 RepID=A0A2K6FAQ5_PROCO